MMIEPAIEKMAEKVGNKYILTSLVSKRAIQLQKKHIREGVTPDIKEISEALNEVANDTLKVDDEN